MKFEIDGLNNLEKNLNKVQKNAKELKGSKEIRLNELFTDDFMRKYTNFNSLNEFFDKSPFGIRNEEDFINLEQKEFDEWVRTNARFNNWDEMQEKAVQEYTIKKLGL